MGETDRQNSRYQPQTLKSRLRKPDQEPPANQSRHKCCLCCWRLWVARISSQGPGLQGLGGFLHTELYPSQFRHDFPPRFLSQKQLSLPQIASLRLQQNSRINRKLESCCISQASFTGKERHSPTLPFPQPTSQHWSQPSLKLDMVIQPRVSTIRRLREKAILGYKINTTCLAFT